MIDKQEFARQVGFKIGRSQEDAQKLIDSVFESLYHYAKTKKKPVITVIGTFFIKYSHNKFPVITLWESPTKPPDQSV